jgi:hypothetical protein
MKALLPLLVFVLLFIAAPLYAQKPVVQDSIPLLKEWWRADDMMYGKNGMTWLDNFYNGKGALVVSTLDGVKTWQMRFPGDTQNVFTWQKGSAIIKTGDFNGDGVTDYMDENANIYEGVKNGEPPKAEAQSPLQIFNPFNISIIIDINGDGYDDMMTAGSVGFGKSKISDMKLEQITYPDIDSNNDMIMGLYSASPKELRILCRERNWVNLPNFPFQKVYKDGLRLVRVWWNGTGLVSQKLDEFTVNTEDSTGIYWNGIILPQLQKKYYYIGATLISGKHDETNVTVYDLSNDKIEMKHTTRIDRIGDMRFFHNSIDADTLPDWCIVHFPNADGYSDLDFYSGMIENSLQPIGKYITCQAPYGVSLPIINGNSSKYGIVYGANHGWCFQVIKLPEITNVTDEDAPFTSTISIEVISPQPISNNQTLQIQLSTPLSDNCELSLYSYSGSKILTFINNQILKNNKIISIPLTNYHLLKGVYWLTLTVGKEQVQSKLSIN